MKSRAKFILALFLLLPHAHALLAATVSFESTNKQTALLELYTSEGCSNCPPADRWLSSLQKNDGLWRSFIPIALHVDYWDYIGWKDRFANPAYSTRQRQYARQQSLKTVYTPGFVYNGKEWRNWFARKLVDFPEGNDPGVLELNINNGMASVQFRPNRQFNNELIISVALLGFDLKTSVKAGENQGRELPHNFVVLGINADKLTPDNNFYKTQLRLPETKINAPRYAVAAWVSTQQTQAPLQSVGGWLPE